MIDAARRGVTKVQGLSDAEQAAVERLAASGNQHEGSSLPPLSGEQSCQFLYKQDWRVIGFAGLYADTEPEAWGMVEPAQRRQGMAGSSTVSSIQASTSSMKALAAPSRAPSSWRRSPVQPASAGAMMARRAGALTSMAICGSPCRSRPHTASSDPPRQGRLRPQYQRVPNWYPHLSECGIAAWLRVMVEEEATK